MTIKVAPALLLLAGLLLAVGVFLGLSGVRAGGFDCGSAWNSGVGTDIGIVMRGGGLGGAAACEDARSSRNTLTWALMIPGIILALAGLVLMARERNGADDSAAARPTADADAEAAVRKMPRSAGLTDADFRRLGESRRRAAKEETD